MKRVPESDCCFLVLNSVTSVSVPTPLTHGMSSCTRIKCCSPAIAGISFLKTPMKWLFCVPGLSACLAESFQPRAPGTCSVQNLWQSLCKSKASSNKNARAGSLITIGEDKCIMEIIGCACCLVNAVAVVEKHVGSLESTHLSLRHNFSQLVCSCVVAIFAVADDVASAHAQRRSRKADYADYQRIRNAALQHGTVGALLKDNTRAPIARQPHLTHHQRHIQGWFE